jgi:hypothetical protein
VIGLLIRVSKADGADRIQVAQEGVVLLAETCWYLYQVTCVVLLVGMAITTLIFRMPWDSVQYRLGPNLGLNIGLVYAGPCLVTLLHIALQHQYFGGISNMLNRFQNHLPPRPGISRLITSSRRKRRFNVYSSPHPEACMRCEQAMRSTGTHNSHRDLSACSPMVFFMRVSSRMLYVAQYLVHVVTLFSVPTASKKCLPVPIRCHSTPSAQFATRKL